VGLLTILLGPMSYFHAVQYDAACRSGAEEGFIGMQREGLTDGGRGVAPARWIGARAPPSRWSEWSPRRE